MMIMTDPATGKGKKPATREPDEVPAESPPAPSPDQELDLVQRARDGNLAAYDELVQRYQQRIYATIYHMTANHEDANDLAQEAFIKAYQAIKTFKGGSSFYTWVYRIAVNKTINFLKQRKNRSQMSLNDLDFNAEHDPDLVALISEKTPRREVSLTELQEKLNEALQKLSEPIDWSSHCTTCRVWRTKTSQKSWNAISARFGRASSTPASSCRVTSRTI